jgi:hypothetical protein
LSRLVVAAANLRFRLQGADFRVFTHPPADLLAALERDGLSPAYAHRGLAWRVAGLERSA